MADNVTLLRNDFKRLSTASPYLYNYCTVRKYGNQYKHVHHKGSIRRSGLDLPKKCTDCRTNDNFDSSGDARFESSVSRTRSTVYELAACNDWQWFCTFTLSADKGWDRCNLDDWRKDFAQWLRNQRRLTGCDTNYLIVPENHKDGAWHMHGLLMGLPPHKLRRLTLNDHLPYKLLKRLKNGEKLYTWLPYASKYGYSLVEPIRNHDRCASYISKYVTKAMSEPTLSGNKHMYYASQGLARSELVASGYLPYGDDTHYTYSNDYVELFWSDRLVWDLIPD